MKQMDRAPSSWRWAMRAASWAGLTVTPYVGRKANLAAVQKVQVAVQPLKKMAWAGRNGSSSPMCNISLAMKARCPTRHTPWAVARRVPQWWGQRWQSVRWSWANLT